MSRPGDRVAANGQRWCCYVGAEESPDSTEHGGC